MIERRTRPGITACDLVMVGWHDGIGRLSQLGNVEDLSLGGMGILVYNDLPVGTPVTDLRRRRNERHHQACSDLNASLRREGNHIVSYLSSDISCTRTCAAIEEVLGDR